MNAAQPKSYLEFDDANSFAYKVHDINSFQMTIDFPMIADWENDEIRARLQDRLHDDMIALLQTAQFYSESQLQQSKSADNFSILYKDDIYDFQVSVYQNKVVISKSGLKMQTFHFWYQSALPGMRTLVSSLLDLMEELLRRKMNVTNVIYRFGFVAYDFRKDAKENKNYQVLNRLITKIPGSDGMIESVEGSSTEISRADYKVNVWDRNSSDGRLSVTYDVSAPANRDYSGLWFNFLFGTQTYSDPDTGQRQREMPEQMLEEYDTVYRLLWRKGIQGFMRSLLDGLEFKTTATYIP